MQIETYNPKTDEIVISFVEELKKSIPDYLKNIALYGSRARGDSKKYSDYDFMVLLNKKDEEISERIYDTGYYILDTYDKLASCLIWDEKDWELNQKLSLGKNINREGIWVL